MELTENGDREMGTNNQRSSRKSLTIDFLFIDLTTCTRCKGTDVSIKKALDSVAAVLESAGVEVVLRKILIDSEQKAMEHRFVSSPTIRVNGRDQEAAEVVGISLSGMKSRVQRARRKLKETLLECCRIEVDRRGGIMDFSVRDNENRSCHGCSQANFSRLR